MVFTLTLPRQLMVNSQWSMVNKKTMFNEKKEANSLPFFEPLVGFEPTTPRLQITCSGQLS
jgi:hypothetical protein